MKKLDVCSRSSPLFFVICSSCLCVVLCESDEQEPIPELNDYEEAYDLLEYAKTTINPLTQLPSISTTNKQIAEYLLLRGGVSKWRRSTILSVNRGPVVDQPACVVHRMRKEGSIKHKLFKEKNIKIKKEFGTYEEHTIAFQYNWGAVKRKIEMLKCSCLIENVGRSSSRSQSIKSTFNFTNEYELKVLEKNGKKVKLRIIPTTKIMSRSASTDRTRDNVLSSIDEYPYQSSEEDSIRAEAIRLQEKVSAMRLLDRDICINGHVSLGRGINGDNSFFVFARDRGFLRVVAHLVLK